METPNKWIILKHKPREEEEHFRIFASWAGGYLDGDSWSMSSGIVKAHHGDEGYVCTTMSGNCYTLTYGSYGVAGVYNMGILTDLYDRFKDKGHGLVGLGKYEGEQRIKDKFVGATESP